MWVQPHIFLCFSRSFIHCNESMQSSICCDSQSPVANSLKSWLWPAGFSFSCKSKKCLEWPYLWKLHRVKNEIVIWAGVVSAATTRDSSGLLISLVEVLNFDKGGVIENIWPAVPEHVIRWPWAGSDVAGQDDPGPDLNMHVWTVLNVRAWICKY